MPGDFAKDLTALLSAHGKITHFIEANPPESMAGSQIALICLSSGVSFVVPMGDGQVAADLSDGVPDALNLPNLQLSEPEPTHSDADDGGAALDGDGAADAFLARLAPKIEAIPEFAEMLEQLKDRIECLEFAAKEAMGANSGGASDSGSTNDQVGQLEDVTSRIGAGVEKLEELSQSLTQHPVLSFDPLDYRRSVARFNTAAATVIGRLEGACDKLAAAGGGANGEGSSESQQALKEAMQELSSVTDLIRKNSSGVSESGESKADGRPGDVSDVLIGLCAAVLDTRRAASQGGNGAAASDMVSAIQDGQAKLGAELMKMQETAIASQAEAILDLKHTLAEFLADQKRTSTEAAG